MMRAGRWFATMLAVALGHGVWATAAMPCAVGRPAVSADVSAPVDHAAHAAHAAHHAAVVTEASDATDAAPRPADAPADECPLLLQCALLLGLPSAPTRLAPAAIVPSAVTVPADAWRDGPPLTLDPPPPKRA